MLEIIQRFKGRCVWSAGTANESEELCADAGYSEPLAAPRQASSTQDVVCVSLAVANSPL